MRKIHIIVFAPSLDVAKKINVELEKIGNIKSDGRPILGLDAKELAKIILNVSDKEYGNFEWQANEFAGRLLVPHGELVKEMERVLEIIKENNLAEFLEKDSDAVLSRVSPTLCKPFGVSTFVIGERVKREGLWPPEL